MSMCLGNEPIPAPFAHPEYEEDRRHAFLMQTASGPGRARPPRVEVRLATDLMVLANRSHGTGLVPRMSIRVVAGF